MFKRKCKAVFIRNGSTIYTAEKRLYEADDYPAINQRGKDEMEAIGDLLKSTEQKFDIIYCSSALRSVQSARIISRILKVDYEIIEELKARKAGIWAGMTFKQIEEQYPEMLAEYHRNPCTFWPEGGESNAELKARVGFSIDKLVSNNIDKNIIVVTHQGVIQSAISHALDIAPQHQAKVYIAPGSATQINFYDQWASLVYSGIVPLAKPKE